MHTQQLLAYVDQRMFCAYSVRVCFYTLTHTHTHTSQESNSNSVYSYFFLKSHREPQTLDTHKLHARTCRAAHACCIRLRIPVAYDAHTLHMPRPSANARRRPPLASACTDCNPPHISVPLSVSDSVLQDPEPFCRLMRGLLSTKFSLVSTVDARFQKGACVRQFSENDA